MQTFILVLGIWRRMDVNTTKRRGLLSNSASGPGSLQAGSLNTNSGTGHALNHTSHTSHPPQTADLASLFECPVCFDYVLPPIFQCQAGHLACSNCRPKLTCCPTCRGPLGKYFNVFFLFFNLSKYFVLLHNCLCAFVILFYRQYS